MCCGTGGNELLCCTRATESQLCFCALKPGLYKILFTIGLLVYMRLSFLFFFINSISLLLIKQEPPQAVLVFECVCLLLVVGAAHALIAFAGMAVAVRAHVDGLKLAHVLRAVMAAGGYGTMNGLVHDHFLQILIFEHLLELIVPDVRRIMLPYNFARAALQTESIAAIIKEALWMRIWMRLDLCKKACSEQHRYALHGEVFLKWRRPLAANKGEFCLWNIRCWAKRA